ncbi:MAG: ATP-dependent DNA ligase [Arthrobacter sp.]
MSTYFPELLEALAGQVPPGCVLDGEAVVWSGDRLDFDALQRRLVASKAGLPALIREQPASFVAFDLLSVAGHDIRGAPLEQRRELLEQLAAGWVPPLNLSPITQDRPQALTWFEELHHAGLEGLVVKGAGQSYQGGVRQWVKVKRRESLDVVCGAVIGPMDQPQYVVAGLPVEGQLRIVGRSTPLTAKAAQELAAHLQSPKGPHPWPEVITENMLNRFSMDKGPGVPDAGDAHGGGDLRRRRLDGQLLPPCHQIPSTAAGAILCRRHAACPASGGLAIRANHHESLSLCGLLRRLSNRISTSGLTIIFPAPSWPLRKPLAGLPRLQAHGAYPYSCCNLGAKLASRLAPFMP